MASHVPRSIELLKRRGFTPGVVEKWVVVPQHPAGGVRRDFLGGIDIIAVRPYRDETWDGESPQENVILGVQVCSGTGLSDHRRKLLAEPRLLEWVQSGGRLVIHAWRTLVVRKKDGTKAKVKRWACNEVELMASDFPPWQAACAAPGSTRREDGPDAMQDMADELGELT